MGGAEVVLSERSNLAAVRDGDRTSLPVRVVVARLLVVLELRRGGVESASVDGGQGEKNHTLFMRGRRSSRPRQPSILKSSQSLKLARVYIIYSRLGGGSVGVTGSGG